MSLIAIRAAFETALGDMSPTIATAYENVPFTPAPGTPFQSVYMLAAEPDDIEMTGAIYQVRGYFQVNLFYPLDAGSNAAVSRAELIRSTFYRGRSLSASGITVTIEKTPEIAPGSVDDDRYMIPVKIRFLSNITRS